MARSEGVEGWNEKISHLFVLCIELKGGLDVYDPKDGNKFIDVPHVTSFLMSAYFMSSKTEKSMEMKSYLGL